MADVHTPDLSYMVFAEQRWMAMCAAQMKKKIHALSSLPELFGGSRGISRISGDIRALCAMMLPWRKSFVAIVPRG